MGAISVVIFGVVVVDEELDYGRGVKGDPGTD